MKVPLAILLHLWVAGASSALAEGATHQKIAEIAVREARDIIARDLFGHYDVTELEVLNVGDLRHRIPERDYGLLRVTLRFSATRNATRSPSLSAAVYEPGRCWAALYLHCGVAPGHVFAGRLELLLAVDTDGAWRAVSPHWRSRRQYPLDGYLLLDGRAREGYVVPKPP